MSEQFGPESNSSNLKVTPCIAPDGNYLFYTWHDLTDPALAQIFMAAIIAEIKQAVLTGDPELLRETGER